MLWTHTNIEDAERIARMAAELLDCTVAVTFPEPQRNQWIVRPLDDIYTADYRYIVRLVLNVGKGATHTYRLEGDN
jgi:hypothetical protein